MVAEACQPGVRLPTLKDDPSASAFTPRLPFSSGALDISQDDAEKLRHEGFLCPQTALGLCNLVAHYRTYRSGAHGSNMSSHLTAWCGVVLG
jgi:hypothetical protein